MKRVILSVLCGSAIAAGGAGLVYGHSQHPVQAAVQAPDPLAVSSFPPMTLVRLEEILNDNVEDLQGQSILILLLIVRF